MFEELRDKVILITGSSRGIGFATAKLLHSLGVKVILNSAINISELKASASSLEGSHFELCDITDNIAVKNMIDNIISKYGKIDGLVNNAGGGGWGMLTDTDDTEWDKSYKLDIMGAVHTSRYIAPLMKKQKSGSIVNVASMWGLEAATKPAISSYCVAKAAIIKLTECLANEFAPEVRVNAVSPGWTHTPMLEPLMTEEGKDFMFKNTLLNRIAEPEEIASVIAFLLSNMASFITAENIVADGGYRLAREHI